MWVHSILCFLTLMATTRNAWSNHEYNGNPFEVYLHGPSSTYRCYPHVKCKYRPYLRPEYKCQPYGNCNHNPLLVQLSNGLVEGQDNPDFYSWVNIPYAQHPKGMLRFEPPQPYNRKWSYVFNASGPLKLCPQLHPWPAPGADNFIGQEDCLTVSIYKAKAGCDETLPVMVTIPGGSFMFGGGSDLVDYIMKQVKMIIVKVQYRLGPLGFLSTEDDIIAGNFGLKDQHLALKWIYDNIACFGGDPKKITLVGHGAGGSSVHLHLMQPELRNYAKAAVAYSGTALSPWVITEKPRDTAFKLGKFLDCPDTKDSKVLKCCLQHKTAEEIVRASARFRNVGSSPFTTFGPVIEHKRACQPYMTVSPETMIKSGKISDTPLLLGLTAENGAYNIAEFLKINPDTYKEFIYELNDRWEELAVQNLFLQNRKNPVACARELRKRYMGYDYFSVKSYSKVQRLYTDSVFKNDVFRTVQMHQECGTPPIFLYNYSNPRDPGAGGGYTMSQRTDIDFGTTHKDDVCMMFKQPHLPPLRYDEQIISKKMIDMIFNFMETGRAQYDKCEFADNTAKKSNEIDYVFITRDGCKSTKEDINNGNPSNSACEKSPST